MGFINITYEPPEQEEVTTWETPQMEVWDVDDTPIIEYPPIPTLPPEDPMWGINWDAFVVSSSYDNHTRNT